MDRRWSLKRPLLETVSARSHDKYMAKVASILSYSNSSGGSRGGTLFLILTFRGTNSIATIKEHPGQATSIINYRYPTTLYLGVLYKVGILHTPLPFINMASPLSTSLRALRQANTRRSVTSFRRAFASTPPPPPPPPAGDTPKPASAHVCSYPQPARLQKLIAPAPTG